jgi:hypothetical protein
MSLSIDHIQARHAQELYADKVGGRYYGHMLNKRFDFGYPCVGALASVLVSVGDLGRKRL